MEDKGGIMQAEQNTLPLERNSIDSEGVFVGSVRLTPDHFRKEKNDYRIWELAWFREALQNSLDAGSTKISFTIQNDEENPGHILVVCEDNGVGMDRHTLLHKFLTMGGSQKADGSIGGFGKAKSLLAFAHPVFEIATQDELCSGVYCDFKIAKVSERRKGVKLSVRMSRKETSVSTLDYYFKTVIANSNLPEAVEITLNSVPVKCEPVENEFSIDTTLGHLKFRDLPEGNSYSKLWIRMRGLAMFEVSISSRGNGCAFSGVLDLSGDSLDILTSNRDGLSENHTAELNKIVQDLVNDRGRLKLASGIDTTLNKKEIRWEDLSWVVKDEIAQAAEKEGISNQEMLHKLVNATDELNTLDPAAANPFRSLRKRVMKTKDAIRSKLDKINEEWYPTNWKILHSSSDQNEQPEAVARVMAETMTKVSTAKLAAGWNALIKGLLENEDYRSELGVEKRSDGSFTKRDMLIQTGFVYGSVKGLNKIEKDESGYERVNILVNPVICIEQGLLPGDLVDIAHHELTHLVADHGEYFSSVEMNLKQICRHKMGNERQMVAVFEQGIAEWRDLHSGKKKDKPSRHQDPSYGM
ncbi:ATP-binding protein [Pseudomonas aeruginosa]